MKGMVLFMTVCTLLAGCAGTANADKPEENRAGILSLPQIAPGDAAHPPEYSLRIVPPDAGITYGMPLVLPDPRKKYTLELYRPDRAPRIEPSGPGIR